MGELFSDALAPRVRKVLLKAARGIWALTPGGWGTTFQPQSGHGSGGRAKVRHPKNLANKL